MHHISILIRHDLKFNVLRMLHKMLDVHSVISKSCLGLFLCSTECHVKSGFIFRHTHSFSASAESRLYDHRIADLSCNFFSFFS